MTHNRIMGLGSSLDNRTTIEFFRALNVPFNPNYGMSNQDPNWYRRPEGYLSNELGQYAIGFVNHIATGQLPTDLEFRHYRTLNISEYPLSASRYFSPDVFSQIICEFHQGFSGGAELILVLLGHNIQSGYLYDAVDFLYKYQGQLVIFRDFLLPLPTDASLANFKPQDFGMIGGVQGDLSDTDNKNEKVRFLAGPNRGVVGDMIQTLDEWDGPNYCYYPLIIGTEENSRYGSVIINNFEYTPFAKMPSIAEVDRVYSNL